MLRYGLGLLLGALGLWLNQFRFSLLVESTSFLFGGALVLLSFVGLGVGPGLLTTVISLTGNALTGYLPPSALPVYVVEGWIVVALYRRVASLVAASAIYWITVGWLADLVIHVGIARLPMSFVMLLLVKQLLNGFLNALAAEAILWLTPAWIRAALGSSRPPERLQFYVFRRVLFAVLLPLFGLTFLYAGVSYERRENASRAEQLRTLGELRVRFESEALQQNEALARLGRMVEISRAAGRGDTLAGLLPPFAAAHPEFSVVGFTDRDGVILAALPDRTASGARLVGQSAAGRRYFSEARRLMRMSSVPQVIGADGTRPGLPPVVAMAPPLIDASGIFDGIVFGIVDHARLQALVSAPPRYRGQLTTLVGGDFRVIASADPLLPPGILLEPRVPENSLRAAGSSTFVYLARAQDDGGPAPPSDVRSATYQAIPAFNLGIMVDLPMRDLQQQILPTTFSVVGVLVLTLGLAYLVGFFVSRRMAEPLSRASQVAADIAAGRLHGPEPVEALGRSGVEEIQSLGANLLTMQEGLQKYRELSAARERESEERFSATFHQAAVGIAHLDPECRWLRVNERLCAIVGAPAEALLGRPIAEITHADDREASERLFHALLAGEERSEGLEVRYVRAGGGNASAQITVSLVLDAAGAPKYFILVMEDVAPRKRLEAELLQAQKMESVGRLAGGVAHDFNNLLTAILGYGEILAVHLADNPVGMAHLHQIRDAGERASRLTRQLLAFARRQVIEPRIVDLNELVRGMESMLRRLIGENIEMESRLAPIESVRADPGQIEQVVLNLVVNARDAMPGGGRLTLSTAMLTADAGHRLPVPLAHGRYVALTVADTGEGMTPDVLSQIFEPFFTTKQREKGTGLGLATCYGIVKQSGGDIEVASEPGKGAAFRVYLPAVPGASPETTEARASVVQGGFETVLVVEDELAVARMASLALERQGYRVLLAEDGRAALALLDGTACEPDLLVTDVIMPNIGGPELAARLRAARPALRVLFTSGYSYDGMGQKGEIEPGTAFLQKPFTPAALARAVREVLDRPIV